MSAENMKRRDFLKMLGISPLLLVNWPDIDLGGQTSPGGISQGPANILIVVFDALSARHMSLYGYPRRTTPNLERISEKATVFHRHYAAGNFTMPGTASLLTGVYPWTHRGFHVDGSVDESYWERSLFNLLTEKGRTFAYSHNGMVNNLFHQFQQDIDEWTRLSELCLASQNYADLYFEEDYLTAYDAMTLLLWHLTAPSSSFFLSRFSRVFQYLVERSLNEANRREFPRGVPNFSTVFFTIEDAIDWIKAQVRKQPDPFMGYVHLMPPHYPYTTRKEFINLFDDGWSPDAKPAHPLTKGYSDFFLTGQRRLYDEFISYVDDEFGRLYDSLEEMGVLDDTLLIFTSDHGEMFERGIWAHTTATMFEPILRIPLLVWSPGQDRRQDVFTPTSCVDLLPTMLALTGQSIPEWMEGQVLPTLNNDIVSDERSIFAVDAKQNHGQGPLTKVSVALIKDSYKMVHYLGYEGYPDEYELYNVEEDPEELLNLYPTHKSVADTMRNEIKQKLMVVNQPYKFNT